MPQNKRRRGAAKEGDSYTLTYFDGRGLAEVSRLLFTIAGVKFEDVRINADDDDKQFIAEYKDKCAFRKVPQLTYNGVDIPQSKAIERFLAKKFKLFGKKDIDAVLIDAFGEQIRDITFGFTSSKTEETREKFWNETFPTLIENTARVAGKEGFLVGNKLSLADIQFYYLTTTFLSDEAKVNAVLQKYENLVKVRDNVAKNEKIVEYVSKRKVTEW